MSSTSIQQMFAKAQEQVNINKKSTSNMQSSNPRYGNSPHIKTFNPNSTATTPFYKNGLNTAVKPTSSSNSSLNSLSSLSSRSSISSLSSRSSHTSLHSQSSLSHLSNMTTRKHESYNQPKSVSTSSFNFYQNHKQQSSPNSRQYFTKETNTKTNYFKTPTNSSCVKPNHTCSDVYNIKDINTFIPPRTNANNQSSIIPNFFDNNKITTIVASGEQSNKVNSKNNIPTTTKNTIQNMFAEVMTNQNVIINTPNHPNKNTLQTITENKSNHQHEIDPPNESSDSVSHDKYKTILHNTTDNTTIIPKGTSATINSTHDNPQCISCHATVKKYLELQSRVHDIEIIMEAYQQDVKRAIETILASSRRTRARVIADTYLYNMSHSLMKSEMSKPSRVIESDNTITLLDSYTTVKDMDDNVDIILQQCEHVDRYTGTRLISHVVVRRQNVATKAIDAYVEYLDY